MIFWNVSIQFNRFIVLRFNHTYRAEDFRKMKSKRTAKDEAAVAETLALMSQCSVPPSLESVEGRRCVLLSGYVSLSVKLQRINNRTHRIMFIEKEQCGCEGNGLMERREALSRKLFRKIILDKRHILHKRITQQLKRNRLSSFYCRTKRRQRSFFPNLTLLWNQ